MRHIYRFEIEVESTEFAFKKVALPALIAFIKALPIIRGVKKATFREL